MMTLKRKEDGFTGLEAAIVLIAFIVVAAVFSYVMLGAGFFTTQKSQETIYSAIGQAATNMEVSGPVILKTGTDSKVAFANFTLILAAGGNPVDITKVVYTVSTQQGIRELDYGNVKDGLRWFNNNSNTLLERGEIIDVGISSGNGANLIEANLPFTIEVKPAVGASLPITRYAPLSFAANSIYEVY
ncbi:MAG: flagellin [Methanocalculus sp.]|uniref:archaellin/type IV pilin N-terminal domain-containing protein n=1 Tax=Methanocalculus sp. TaxID=2004547 RepID=UPI0027193C84|nr:archaellin/type IV pilin N-terminal domain-containing protein [Methanocalculus sp.]MDO9539808.1 flagellin [Methanocalculus sp.]